MTKNVGLRRHYGGLTQQGLGAALKADGV